MVLVIDKGGVAAERNQIAQFIAVAHLDQRETIIPLGKLECSFLGLALSQKSIFPGPLAYACWPFPLASAPLNVIQSLEFCALP